MHYANIATLFCRRRNRNAVAAGVEGAAAAAGRVGLRASPGGGRPRWGQAREAPRGRQTRANPHELASNEECT